jgi:uncharacterized membrane protein
MNKFLQDSQGSESSLRMIMAIWMLVVLAVWAIICLWKEAILDLPTGICALVMFILGAKVWQKYAENKSPPVDKEPCAPDTPAQ